MDFNIPLKENGKLGELKKALESDSVLHSYWKAANINSIDRMNYNDHGHVHVKITANIALKLLRMLAAAGITPSIVKHHGMKNEDAEVVVVLAAALHDVGIAFHRVNHEMHSCIVASHLLPSLVPSSYSADEKVIISSEVQHAIVSHEAPVTPLTVEGGVLRVADALDMAEGRARIPFQTGAISIHAVSATSIKKIELLEGKEKPIEVRISMSNPSGLFQVDELLRARVKGSGLEDYLHVTGEVSGDSELKSFEL